MDHPPGKAFLTVAAGLLPGEVTEEDTLALSVMWHLLRISKSAEAALEYEVHRPLGWSWPGFRVMANVYVLGPLEPSELAEILHVSRPTITVLLNRLERDGFIERSAHPDSKSQVLAHLTPAGRAAVERAAIPHHQTERKIIAGLTIKQARTLATLLERVYASLT